MSDEHIHGPDEPPAASELGLGLPGAEPRDDRVAHVVLYNPKGDHRDETRG